MDFLKTFEKSFLTPEKTHAGVSFCDIPIPLTFNRSEFIVFGVPIDITTTFGKSTSKGPEAIRITSAKQIETLIYEKKIEIFDKTLIYDLGDFILYNYFDNKPKVSNLKDLKLFWNDFDDQIRKVIKSLIDLKKKPVILGGEHTITYSTFKEFSQFNPLFLHFDAHRDMKPSYEGMDICHTTPFYHLLNESYIKGNNLVQIGIRQADKEENKFAKEMGVQTFDAWYCQNSFIDTLAWIKKNTKNRNIYISFDIDVYDITYVPCTGTPEPFGLTPFQIIEILKNIHDTANLLGLDLVETGLKNDDFREGALATHTLLRILSGNYMKK